MLFYALKLAAVVALALLCLSASVMAQFIANPDFTQGDAESGKRVYQRVAVCVNCHGWPGNGHDGVGLQRGDGANLRETKLDAQVLYDTIRCGIPGTQMPYHDQTSYRDGRCNGMLMADFAAGQQPIMGKTLSEKQMVDLVAYLEKYVIGRGKPTYEECALYFGTSADKSCSYLKEGN